MFELTQLEFEWSRELLGTYCLKLAEAVMLQSLILPSSIPSAEAKEQAIERENGVK